MVTAPLYDLAILREQATEAAAVDGAFVQVDGEELLAVLDLLDEARNEAAMAQRVARLAEPDPADEYTCTCDECHLPARLKQIEHENTVLVEQLLEVARAVRVGWQREELSAARWSRRAVEAEADRDHWRDTATINIDLVNAALEETARLTEDRDAWQRAAERERLRADDFARHVRAELLRLSEALPAARMELEMLALRIDVGSGPVTKEGP